MTSQSAFQARNISNFNRDKALDPQYSILVFVILCVSSIPERCHASLNYLLSRPVMAGCSHGNRSCYTPRDWTEGGGGRRDEERGMGEREEMKKGKLEHKSKYSSIAI